MNTRFCFAVFALLVLVTSTFAAPNEVETATAQLQREIELIEKIEPYVERLDLARLHHLSRISANVLKSISEKGLGSRATSVNYQKLILTYRYSAGLFQQIETVRTRPMIEELLKIQEAIAGRYGWDQNDPGNNPYNQLTNDILSQIQEHLANLAKLPIQAELKEQITSLMVPLGKAISIAKQGDRPNAFTAADRVYQSIRALYPLMNQLAQSDAAYYIVLDIQGLMELYGEFAQVDYRSG